MILPPSPAINNVTDCMTAIVSEYGFREETADISGVSVHCVIRDADATDASVDDVFVFIHGTASSSVIFFDVMNELPRNQKCVAIDLPNFGISGRIDLDKYQTNQELCACYSDIIGYTLQKLGIVGRTILVAHSLGGFLSIYVADRFPIKKLVLLNPAGILPTLGEYGYYWGMFFKAGLPSSLFHLPLVSRELLAYICRSWTTTTEFWITLFANPANEGHRILQRLITLRPFYSYWNTPAFTTLMDVYTKVPTTICFGVDDTIIPSHIGEFLRTFTRGEIIIHNIQNANHNPCENIERIVEVLGSVNNDIECGYVKTPRHRRRHRHRRRCDGLCRGYSYHSLQKTQDSFHNVYDYLIKHTTYYPPHSA